MRGGGKARRAGGIDWDEVRGRLARAAAATEQVLALTPERARAVMAERARALARSPEPALPAGAEALRLVTFTLAGERYGVETRYVREVLPLTDHTPVPGAPDVLLGVVNVRGEIVAVFDLRRLFGAAPGAVTDRSRLLVLGGETTAFGVLADTADEVTTLRAEEVLEPPGANAGLGRACVRGVTRDALVVLDGAALLQDDRLVIDQGEERRP